MTVGQRVPLWHQFLACPTSRHATSPPFNDISELQIYGDSLSFIILKADRFNVKAGKNG
jgi:hypothetical protein